MDVVAVPPPGLQARPARVVAPAEERLHLRLEADLEHELGRPGDELAQGVAGDDSLERLRECLLHLDTRWYPLHGVGSPFSVRSGRSDVPTGRRLYTVPFLHRI